MGIKTIPILSVYSRYLLFTYQLIKNIVETTTLKKNVFIITITIIVTMTYNIIIMNHYNYDNHFKFIILRLPLISLYYS